MYKINYPKMISSCSLIARPPCKLYTERPSVPLGSKPRTFCETTVSIYTNSTVSPLNNTEVPAWFVFDSNSAPGYFLPILSQKWVAVLFDILSSKKFLFALWQILLQSVSDSEVIDIMMSNCGNTGEKQQYSLHARVHDVISVSAPLPSWFVMFGNVTPLLLRSWICRYIKVHLYSVTA